MGFGGQGEGPGLWDQSLFQRSLGEATAELARIVPANHYRGKRLSIIAFWVITHEVFPLGFGDGGVGDKEASWNGGTDLCLIVRSAWFAIGTAHDELAGGAPLQFECGKEWAARGPVVRLVREGKQSAAREDGWCESEKGFAVADRADTDLCEIGIG